MGKREKLLEISRYVESGSWYKLDELDFGIVSALDEYIERQGYEGTKDLLAMLGYLAYEVQNRYYKIVKSSGGQINEEIKNVKG